MTSNDGRFRKGMVPWNKGKGGYRVGPHTEEAKLKMSVKAKEREKNPQYAAAKSQRAKRQMENQWADETFRTKALQAPQRVLGWKHTPESLEKISDASKRNWRIGAFNTRPSPDSPSKKELSLVPLLSQLGFTHSGAGGFWLTGRDGKHRNPDFVDFRGRRVIEFFGSYWHRKDKGNEQTIIKWYRDIGFECAIVWEGQIVG